MDTRNKILPLEPLAARIAQHKNRGERIVLANGCFDVLHVGHARYLDGARREGDVLVVGVNSDPSVRSLKGEGRPILPAEARARLVAGLAAVSYVVLFDEADVTRLLSILRPDVHAKGTDYTTETVPERETARRLGVRIAIVGDPKEHSTRDLLARLRTPSMHESSPAGSSELHDSAERAVRRERMSTPGPGWARWRAPLGYPTAVLCLWLAHPTFRSILLGFLIAAVGLLIRAAAAGHLHKREALARTGPYARTRNPLYFGSALIAAGFALAGRSWIGAALLAIYFGIFYAQVMRREESELRQQYGKAFDDYAASVPLFWPRLRLKSSRSATQFSLAQYIRNREYNAAIGAALTIAVLSALAMWRK